MSENPKPPTQPSLTTPAPANHNLPRRSRPRVREVSSRFMSPVVSTPKQPPPSSRRSQTDLRTRYGDENRPDSVNRRSVSPVRSVKPRSAIKLFSRPDTPVSTGVGRVFRQQNWDTPSKSVRVSNCEDSETDTCSIDGDCESVKSESSEISNRNNSNNNNGGIRVSTPCSRSMEQLMSGSVSKGGGGKVGRSVNLPPIPPSIGGFGRGFGTGTGTGEVKKAVRKGTNHVEDVHRLRLLYNHHLQWRFANAKAQTSIIARKKQSERQLYSLGLKISEMRESVNIKRIEYGFLKTLRTTSTILDAQMPYLDEWSNLEESYSSSLLELSNGLLNALSQLPLVGNVTANVKEIEEALQSASKVTEMICQQVQCFMPKGEHVDSLISDLARVHSREITLVDECGDLLSKTHLSQVEECSLRGQLVQLHQFKRDELKVGLKDTER